MKRRQISVLFEFAKFLEERLDVIRIASGAGGLRHAVVGAHVRRQARHRAFDSHRAVGLAHAAAVFAIAAIRQSGRVQASQM